MKQTWDAIVLGVGGVGSAALFHLASRGLRVLGIEQHEPGHALGSSHGQTRIIRKAYFEHPDYVPLLQRGYELWDELQNREQRQDLFVRTGLLQIGPMGGQVIPGVLESARLHGLDVEKLDSDQVAARFPGFRCEAHQSVVFERDAGFLRVEDCVLAHVRQAVSHGAEVRSGVVIEEWNSSRLGVEVSTSEGDFSAGALVVTAGAWAPQLLRHLGVEMRVLRKQLYWLASPSGIHRIELDGPCFFYELPEGQFYGFPELAAGEGVKMACHSGGDLVVDPTTVNREINQVELGKVQSFASQWLPGTDSNLLRHATCMYTMSPDEHFIVDRHPQQPNVSFAAGLSGHGFKFASVLGEVLADLATDGHTALPARFLGLRRFGLARGGKRA